MHIGATATLREAYPTTYQMNKARTILYTPHTTPNQTTKQTNKDKLPSSLALGLSLFSLGVGLGFEVSA